MAGNLQQRLDSLKSKTQLLVERYARMENARREAESRSNELEQEIARKDRETKVLRQQLEQLQVVTTLSPAREDVERSRKFFAELLRDIDKCINELSE